jgi:hypothetical protein
VIFLGKKRKLFRKNDPYSADDVVEQTFTAHIIKGNRQVVKREVTASKRFKVDEEMYFIRPECIFLKNIDGELRSVSYYREGNPNPYNFQEVNLGIKADELDRLFAEDFYNIIVDLQPKNRIIYLLFICIINLAICVVFDIGVAINAFF